MVVNERSPHLPVVFHRSRSSSHSRSLSRFKRSHSLGRLSKHARTQVYYPSDRVDLKTQLPVLNIRSCSSEKEIPKVLSEYIDYVSTARLSLSSRLEVSIKLLIELDVESLLLALTKESRQLSPFQQDMMTLTEARLQHHMPETTDRVDLYHKLGHILNKLTLSKGSDSYRQERIRKVIETLVGSYKDDSSFKALQEVAIQLKGLDSGSHNLSDVFIHLAQLFEERTREAERAFLDWVSTQGEASLIPITFYKSLCPDLDAYPAMIMKDLAGLCLNDYARRGRRSIGSRLMSLVDQGKVRFCFDDWDPLADTVVNFLSDKHRQALLTYMADKPYVPEQQCLIEALFSKQGLAIKEGVRVPKMDAKEVSSKDYAGQFTEIHAVDGSGPTIQLVTHPEAAGLDKPDVIAKGGHKVLRHAFRKGQSKLLAVSKERYDEDEDTWLEGCQLELRMSSMLGQLPAMRDHVVPPIAAYLAQGKHDTSKLYVLQPLCGEDFFSFSRLRTFTQEEKASISLDLIEQITPVVSTLHRLGYLYRDFKPENILLEGDVTSQAHRFLLTDFGSVGKLKDTEQMRQMIGTPQFLAPEMLSCLSKYEDDLTNGSTTGSTTDPTDSLWEASTSYNEKVDVWGLGCVLHEFFFGCFPYNNKDSDNVVDTMIAISRYRSGPKGHTDNTKVARVGALIKNMVHHDPVSRPSFHDILSDTRLMSVMFSKT